MRKPASLLVLLADLVFCVPSLAHDPQAGNATNREAILEPTPVRYPTVVEYRNAIIAASPRGVIYRSGDNGETWEPIASDLGTLAWQILYKDSRACLYVLRMSQNDGDPNELMRSTNGGVTWRPVLKFTNRDSRTMEIVEDANGMLYLGEYSNQLPRTPHLFRSRDGARWDRYLSVEGGKHIHSMAYNATRDKVLFALGDDVGISGLYESAADGFVQVNGLKILDVLSLSNGLELYLSDLGPGVSVSINNRVFETGGGLREGENEVLHLKGLTLSGIQSFRIKVGGNRRVRYHIARKSAPTHRTDAP